MVGRKKQPATDPRQALLQPLAGYRHKEMTVPTSNEKVIVREPGGDDYLVWQAQIQAVAGEDVTEENAQSVAERIESDSDHTPEASMLVRVLINPSNYQRVFSDEDVELVAANWGPVYGRFLNAAFELAGISGAAPVADAKKLTDQPGLMFQMTLALRLGKTLAELAGHQAPMTARELLLWMAFDQLSPISDRRGDVQAAQIATAVYQSQGAKVSFDDVLIDWGGSDESDEVEDDDALETLFAALAGG